MATLFAGTSGWAYATWKDGFYPKGLGSAKFLNYYATRLNSVEVNYTFSHAVTEQALQTWIEATPPGFSFSFKAPQTITHFQRLRSARKATNRFFESLEPVRAAKKLGPVLFQLPPNFKCDLARFEEFLPLLPPKARVAFEFRHASWFTDRVYALLRRAKVALCLAESDKLETPEVHTAGFTYVRLRKSSYPASARKQWTKKVADYSKRGKVFVYFKHEDTPENAIYAEELLHSFKSS